MMPEKLPEALVRVKVCVPKLTSPLPSNDRINAPVVVAEISNIPLLTRPLELAMLPVPPKAKVTPLLIVVRPV